MYQKTTLPNGVRIVSEAMSAVRSVAIGIWVGVGSRFEHPGEEGSAHFIEHMLFKGTSKSSAAALAERMDAIGGQCNAFTTRESTCFYTRVLYNHFTEAADILSEMFFDSLFREEDVASERGVILEEMGMYKDTPEDLVVENLIRASFPGSLGKPILGSEKSLSAFTGASLRAFKEREYTPDRVVVSVCGSFTDADLQLLCSRFSGWTGKAPAEPRRSRYKVSETFRRKATEQNQLCLAWPGLPDASDERFAMQILSMILGGGMSSRLFQTVREQYGLCYSVGSFPSSFREVGAFCVSAATGRETELKALSLIRQEVDHFCTDGVSAAELNRAKEQMKANVVMSMESTASRMNRLGSSILLMDGCLSADEVIERYDAVTAEDVLSLARRTLRAEVLSISALGRLSDRQAYLDTLKG